MLPGRHRLGPGRPGEYRAAPGRLVRLREQTVAGGGPGWATNREHAMITANTAIQGTMAAMVLHRPGEALRLERLPIPQPGPG